MKRQTLAATGAALTVVVLMFTACREENGAPVAAEQRRYVADICEPFADYFEQAIQAGFPEFTGVTSPDDLLVLIGRLRTISERTLEQFDRIRPPAEIRDTHEQVVAVLEAEIAGYERLEAALESGDPAALEQRLREADELAGLAGIGPSGFFPAGVPPEYEQAWDEECAPRLREIPGVEE